MFAYKDGHMWNLHDKTQNRMQEAHTYTHFKNIYLKYLKQLPSYTNPDI